MRFLNCVLTIISIFFVCIFTVSAKQDGRIYASPSYCSQGEIITIPVCIEDNREIMGYRIIIEYRKDVFKPIETESVGAFSSGMLNNNISGENAGRLEVLWTNSSAVSVDGVIFNVTFEVDEYAPGDEYHLRMSYSPEDTFDGSFKDAELQCDDIIVFVSNNLNEQESARAEQSSVKEEITGKADLSEENTIQHDDSGFTSKGIKNKKDKDETIINKEQIANDSNPQSSTSSEDAEIVASFINNNSIDILKDSIDSVLKKYEYKIDAISEKDMDNVAEEIENNLKNSGVSLDSIPKEYSSSHKIRIFSEIFSSGETESSKKRDVTQIGIISAISFLLIILTAAIIYKKNRDNSIRTEI